MIAKTQKQKIEIASIPPEFGKNYKKGYLGFTYHNNLVVCKGIAYFTKWERMSNIYATHVLLVTGENSCIEADASQNRVKSAPLQPYFDDPHCQIFFRKPKGLNDEIADRIVRVLEPEVGKKYDFRLILGHLLNCLSKGTPEQQIATILNDPEKWICSELVAYGLDEQAEYQDRGILKFSNATITPQELFEDSDIFEPWDKTEISNGHTHCS